MIQAVAAELGEESEGSHMWCFCASSFASGGFRFSTYLKWWRLTDFGSEADWPVQLAGLSPRALCSQELGLGSWSL